MGAEGFRVLKLDERGLVRKFVQNDMCASGSGTFIDEMSAALEVTVEEAWRMSMGAQRTEKISSLCVVFGESEVISAVHRGIPKDEILAGIHEAITERIGTLVRGIRPEQDIVATGGVARNPCIVKMLGKKLGVPVVVTEAPHLVGALGAALLARDLFSRA
jgi:predicted CoA-substrate-specific enzyme activase